MTDILDTILARKAEEVAQRSPLRSLADLKARAADAAPTRASSTPSAPGMHRAFPR